MSELDHSAGELAKAYTFEELQAALSGETWRGLAPNRPDGHDALPQDFSAIQIESLVGALCADTSVTSPLTGDVVQIDQWADATLKIDVPGVGVLDMVNHGDSKICYRLTTPANTRLAVLFCLYDVKGIQVPSDPKLTLMKATGPGLRMHEYNDPRTYLGLQLDEGCGVILREYGGEAVDNPADIFGRMITARRARRYIRASRALGGRRIVGDEFDKLRHYLYKPDAPRLFVPSVIDIPVWEEE